MKTTKAPQTTNTIVMVRPDQFGFNAETAATNAFQHHLTASKERIQSNALHEFTQMVKALRAHDIQVLVLPSRKDAVTPDAVFPNNWFSHHASGALVIYPMLTLNRRAERQIDNLLTILKSIHVTPQIVNFAQEENKGNILEGTGSLVLDRVNKVAFAMESPRTTKEAFSNWCKIMQYEPILFHAYDKTHLPIYHTNVCMSIGDNFAVYCVDAIKETREKKLFEKKLKDLDKELIHISLEQLYAFCGNILQLFSKRGKQKIVMSQSAYNAFTATQKRQLQNHGEFVVVNIPTIEKVSGGSARCMMAEIFPSN